MTAAASNNCFCDGGCRWSGRQFDPGSCAAAVKLLRTGVTLYRFANGSAPVPLNVGFQSKDLSMATERKLPADVYPETLSRLAPPRREALNEDQQKIYDSLTRPPQPGGLSLAGIKGPGGVQMRMPKLGKSFREVNRILRSELGLDGRLVEVAILATAREMSSQFEWAMHESVAIAKGVASQTVDIIRHRKPLAGVPENEAALIELVREAVGAGKVSPQTYARALALFGEEGLLHYSALIGNYAQTAIMLCVFGQELHDHQHPGLPD